MIKLSLSLLQTVFLSLFFMYFCLIFCFCFWEIPVCDDDKHPPLIPLANSFWAKSAIYVGQPPSQLFGPRPVKKIFFFWFFIDGGDDLIGDENGSDDDSILYSHSWPGCRGAELVGASGQERRQCKRTKSGGLPPPSFSNHNNEADSFNDKK